MHEGHSPQEGEQKLPVRAPSSSTKNLFKHRGPQRWWRLAPPGPSPALGATVTGALRGFPAREGVTNGQTALGAELHLESLRSAREGHELSSYPGQRLLGYTSWDAWGCRDRGPGPALNMWSRIL